MRRIAFGLLAATVLSAGAIKDASADILRALYSPRPVAGWTGFYVGGNIGYGWADLDSTATAGGVTLSGSQDMNGILGGGQLGVNAQFGNWVVGIETDLQASAQKLSSTATVLGVTFSATDRIPWFGTTRARFGVATDRFLIYATGGAGYGQFKSTINLSGGVVGTFTSTDTRFAWVAGGGVEALLSRNLSAKVEYLYFDTGNINSSGVVAGVPVSTTDRLTSHVLRFGMNYFFR